MNLEPLKKTGHCLLCKKKLRVHWKYAGAEENIPKEATQRKKKGDGKGAWWVWRTEELVGFHGIGYFCSMRCGYLFGSSMAEGLKWAREMR